jgi:hypothetical protein
MKKHPVWELYLRIRLGIICCWTVHDWVQLVTHTSACVLSPCDRFDSFHTVCIMQRNMQQWTVARCAWVMSIYILLDRHLYWPLSNTPTFEETLKWATHTQPTKLGRKWLRRYDRSIVRDGRFWTWQFVSHSSVELNVSSPPHLGMSSIISSEIWEC